MKNKVLKAITALAVIAIIFGTASIDSDRQLLPASLVALGTAWLVPFSIANRRAEW